MTCLVVHMVLCRPMGFVMLLVYLVLIFVRPGEQSAALRGWEVMDIASGLALVAAAIGVLAGRGPRSWAVQIPIVFAFFAWMLVSVVASPLRSISALESVLAFAKGSMTAFLLVALNIDTNRRLQVVAVLLTVLSVFVVGQGAYAYHQGIGPSPFVVGSGGIQGSSPGWENAQPEPMDGEARAEATDSRRIRGLGFLNDPNDLAQTLIAILPLTLALRHKGAYLRNALVWPLAGGMVYGVYLTRSRGGILALACVIALLVRARLGRALSLLAAGGALMALLALGFIGGRSMSIDMSARERILAWSAGLQMLKSSPVWGVGFGMFIEFNDKVAHNSFVQCFAELGLVGYFLWLSLIMLTLDDMRAVMREEEQGTAELGRWARALMISMMGFLIGGLFLSRAYDSSLFLLLGLGAAVADLARRQGYNRPSRSPLLWCWSVVGVQIASICILWLYMRFFR